MSNSKRQYGIDISKATSAEDAMERSGLTWAVQEESLMTGSGKDVSSHKALTRADNGGVLGVVGKDYGVIQHSSMFACADALIQSSGAHWDKAYEFNGGKRIALSAILPVNVAPRVGDIVNVKTLISQAFDSTLSFIIELFAERLRCTNGARINVAQSRICIRHTVNAEYRIKQALTFLQTSPACIATYSANVKALERKMVDKAMVEKFLNEVVGEATTIDPETGKVETSTRIQNQRDLVEDLFQHGEGNRGETAWDLYNGATEWVNHYRNENNVDARVRAAMFGSGAEIMDTAMTSALAL